MPPGPRHQPAPLVALPGGAALVVREARADDVDGLARLFDGLHPDDRHRRFFSAYRPGPAFLEGLVTSADRGGHELVAVEIAADGDEQVVAEAGWVPLANGDGELAITVADRWRGWLGPYLLDALLQAAAARGVPNLEADVLLTNRSMLALARARGCVTMGSSDWSVVRVLIGTGRAPTWPADHERTRVLVEGSGGVWHPEEPATAALEVLSCPGPARPSGRCPALAGGACPLAAGADVIVLRRPSDDPRWSALLDAHEHAHPGVPVCIEAPTAPQDPGLPELPHGGGRELVEVLQRLARREG